ncbi:MAG TPA: VWA domain-containing protein [Chloroflexota bacterium]|nr:VWA domain-containing protein [Chloroflexota bacterium]
MLGAARYSRWDGRQEAAVPSPEELIDRLTPRLLEHGDLLRALRELLDGSSQEPGHLDLARLGERLDGLSVPRPALVPSAEALDAWTAVGAAGGWPVGRRPGDPGAAGEPSAGPADEPTGGADDAGHPLSGAWLRDLVEAGYVRLVDGQPTPTPSAIRRIGQAALREVFGGLPPAPRGEHATRPAGVGAEALDGARPWTFGDPFLVDLAETMRHALRRSRGGRVELVPADFRVVRLGRATASATAILIDLSRSMAQRGCVAAARKLALALHALIRGQYPRDELYVIGFAERARELPIEALAAFEAGRLAQGTNLQDALALARAKLDRHRGMARQVLLVTDGEPTAHGEHGRVRIAFPPTHRTIRATLDEVAGCTRAGIVINTFMLDRSFYLVDFVGQMARLNRGRAFFADPERLGRYALVDFVRNSRRQIA